MTAMLPFLSRPPSCLPQITAHCFELHSCCSCGAMHLAKLSSYMLPYCCACARYTLDAQPSKLIFRVHAHLNTLNAVSDTQLLQYKAASMHATCRDMMSAEEGRSFFQQLLHGLLHNLQPLQGPGETQLHSSPLREASKDTLAAACQVLGPQAFLHQVLQSVTGLGTQSASLDPKQLEVRCGYVSDIAPCAKLSACLFASSMCRSKFFLEHAVCCQVRECC